MTKNFLSSTALKLCFIAIMGSVCSLSAAHAQIVPDQNTSTSVSIGAMGRPTVSIAPATPGGVSMNTYNQFSVMPVGANLDNLNVRANTIVNQVTSSNRSYLYGPIEVLGSRAHVIVANPNGITIDGGSFINTGNVILSGGTVRLNGAGAPIIPTGSGDIYVGPGGLTGAMTALHLAAARLKIDGPVVNENVSPNAEISLLAGNSELTADPTVPASSTLRPYVTERKDLGGTSTEYLVDVTPQGYMQGSKVKIAVSAKGAGVSFAGRGYSTIGEFQIDASGKISSRGGLINGEKSVKLTGGSVEILNSPQNQAFVSSNAGPITIIANAGNIDIEGSIIGEVQGSADSDSKGAVTLKATGDISLLSENADRLAIVYGSRGNVDIDAGGNLNNTDARILSNNNIHLKAGGNLNNTTTIIDAVNNGAPIITITRKRTWNSWLFGKKKRVVTTFDYGKTRIDDRALIFGSSISIEAGDIVNSGEISAAEGSLSIVAKSLKNEAVWTGTLSIIKQCGVVCWSKGMADINTIGGVMNAQYGLSIHASDYVINEGGWLVSYGDMEIYAPTVESRAAYVPFVINRVGGLGNLWSGSNARVAYQPLGGYIYAPVGSLAIHSEKAVVLDGGLIQGGSDNEDIPAGIFEVRPPLQNIGPLNPYHLGIFKDILP
ncbi:filamentous hemagglutinin N-terminal domain-containing protein [Microvirga sp. W0021]|uniref:Filamentous hemagglutinin N-terminal domain-containing protein n=1 Tax=Hohaiivirga grylli TaxID=3133970 RepID=A0ABV0BL95_9HYPH